jgi:hypothetical protein
MRSMPVRELMLCFALTVGYFTPVYSDEATTTAAAPETPTKDAEATASTSPTTTEETEEKMQRAEFERVAKQYKKTEKDGQTFYCRSEATLGTRLKKPVCLTDAQLWERIRKAEDVRDQMRKGGGGSCKPPMTC